MANRLHGYYDAGYLHFITTSCYQRMPFLGSPHSRGEWGLGGDCVSRTRGVRRGAG